MNYTMIAAVSTDGYIADAHGSTNWTSKEDQENLQKEIKKSDALVMGATTFLHSLKGIKNPASIKRYVYTSNPKKYTSYAHLATFISLPIPQLHELLLKNGHKNIAILGGSKIYTDFLLSGLVTTITLTVEPVILSQGTPFLTDSDLRQFTGYKVVSEKRINAKKTTLKTYVKQN